MKVADLILTLDQEIVPAVGCTEPVAIALTSAAAMNAVNGKLRLLELATSMNIFKNARAAGIPGCVDTGIELAAALGAAIARPEASLEIFSYVGAETLAAARLMLKTAEFRTSVDMNRNDMYVRCRVVTDVGEAIAETVGRHHNVHLVSLNGKDVPLDLEQNRDGRLLLREETSFRELVEAVYDAPCGTFDFLISRTDVNLKMADSGYKMGQGLGITKEISPTCYADYAATACDARMSGVQKPICTCAGSGNLGISATVPVLAAGRAEGASPDLVARSLALSLAVTIYVKEYFGLLSPVCGCAVAAGAGSAAGLVMLRGGDASAVENAASAVLSALAGMLCDGGKVGCALKVWTAVSTAEKSACLALAGASIPSGNGIVGRTIDDTLSALEYVTEKGLSHLDSVLVDVMR
jgi:L-cysteine desulfidase